MYLTLLASLLSRSGSLDMVEVRVRNRSIIGCSLLVLLVTTPHLEVSMSGRHHMQSRQMIGPKVWT